MTPLLDWTEKEKNGPPLTLTEGREISLREALAIFGIVDCADGRTPIDHKRTLLEEMGQGHNLGRFDAIEGWHLVHDLTYGLTDEPD